MSNRKLYPPRTEHSAREDYADAMIDVQSRCRDDGRSFFAEMTTLLAAWLEQRRALGHRDDLVTVESPEPDPDEGSPAFALYQSAVGRASSPSSPPPPPPVNCGCALPPPPLPADGRARMRGDRPGTRAGAKLNAAHLYDLLAEGGPPMSIPAGVKLANARTRCSEISSLCKTHRLRALQLPDGTIEIRRCKR